MIISYAFIGFFPVRAGAPIWHANPFDLITIE
ncbi:hypothetical protein TH47_07795 [Thalassospira sp. MCCC 1A02803]|nr:hypothetical protein TH47_07795 [Thalassospira sp. MCCC 1A02803]